LTDDPMRQADIDRRLANMTKAPRCGARTRSGRPCRQAAVRGRARCRMHGGAKGSGGPSGAPQVFAGIMECAPNGGQIADWELTGAAGLSEDESHGQAPQP
jgi:hypothetical protein